MGDTNFRGPVNSLGALMGNVSTQAGLSVGAIEPTDGPSYSYQGMTIPDVRFYPANKDSMKAARVPVFLASGGFMPLTDGIPQALAANALGTAQNIVASTPMTLLTVCPGGAAVNTTFSRGCPAIVPLRPMTGATGQAFPPNATLATYKSGSTTAVSGVLALDFGFSVGSTTAGSGTVTSIPAVGAFFVGQWICIGGAGNAAKTTALVTQVTAVGTSTLTISPVAQGTLAAAPIGSANFQGPFPAQGAADAVSPYTPAGVAAVFSPTETIARAIRIVASSSSAVGGTFTVSGYDIYGMAMTETINLVPATSVTTYGTKAWKYISSVIPSNTDAGFTYTIGTSDVFGIHLLSPKWEHLQVNWDATYMSTSLGWLAGVGGTATATTGDVRGTIQTGAGGGGTGISGGAASNGSKRLTIGLAPNPRQLIYATPVAPSTLFGSTQA